ncbi:HAD-like domain-containing protein [Leucosporidium creatinivorum]|uniref:Mitochondrial import inner membrane translocase subunit TIM50 n=1 Tax=Leucosporidium creatinivorum TaxID=106004 RepID=A0A1Y2FCU5_9BASI|nr:HAD-like domain-containing protein [Leucosporidium creatinivorum]
MLLSAARQALRQQPARFSALPSRCYATAKPPRPSSPAATAPTRSPTEKSPSSTVDAPPAAAAPPPPASAEPLTTPPPADAATATTPPTPAPEQALSTRANSLAEQFLDLSEVAPEGSSSSSGNTFPGETTGAKAKGTGSSSIEQKRKKLTRGMIGASLVGLLAGSYHLAKDWESEEEKMKMIGRSDDAWAIKYSEEGGWKSLVGRAFIRGEDYMDYLNKPAWDPLLPAPLPEPHYRPYTLVVDLDDMLVHSSWDLEHGWRTAKRPGADYFLAYLSQFYEVVLFTTQPAYTAAPICEKIDPYGAYIPWKLFRESTRYKNKALIKDLTYLGRPLERTIILDTNPEHFQLQPENAIQLAPWTGKRDATTKELVSLIPFLEALAIRGVKDVRPVIKHYEGRHIPTAYAEAEAAQKKALVDKWEKDRESTVSTWISAALGSLTKSRDTPPETDVEKVRKNAQRMYLEEQKYWKDNEEIIKKQMDEDRERQLKEMKGSVLGMMGLAAPPAPGQEQPKA